mgnify:CR=1 FL=1
MSAREDISTDCGDCAFSFFFSFSLSVLGEDNPSWSCTAEILPGIEPWKLPKEINAALNDTTNPMPPPPDWCPLRAGPIVVRLQLISAPSPSEPSI